jgi:hypothetical protein
VCKILVDIVGGGNDGGQEWATKLGFHFLLPLSLLIEKTFFLIMSIETKDEHFYVFFLFVLMMHSIFVKRVVMFSHESLNICSCMSRMMLMHC